MVPWCGQVAGTNTAFSGPRGVSYTANLTPDQNTGLGIWTERILLRHRLQEKCPDLRILSTGRGRCSLRADAAIEMIER